MPEITYKEILGLITVIMIFWGYGKYIIDVFKGKTKPHMFSWIIFFITASITFLVQYNDGAGPGAWAFGTSIITTGIIAFLSLFKGTTDITKSDSISFVLGILAIFLYIFAANPLYSLLLATLIAGFGFYPTFRKSYHKPNEETLIAYILAGTRSIISIFALTNLSLLTLTTPIFISMVNISFVILVLVRKKQLKK